MSIDKGNRMDYKMIVQMRTIQMRCHDNLKLVSRIWADEKCPIVLEYFALERGDDVLN